MKYKNDIERIVESLDTLKNNFPKDFPLLIDDIVSIKGDVITVGIGKSGIIATKLSSTLCSVGVRSFFVHPVEMKDSLLEQYVYFEYLEGCPARPAQADQW